MAKLCEKGDEMDEDTKEIQRVVYTHRFTGRVSTYFLHTSQYKSGYYGRHSTILLQYNYKVGFLSHPLNYTLNILLGKALIYKKCVKPVSFHYLLIKSNFSAIYRQHISII